MTEGKYYIAVQAVDAGNMGGEWSDEFVYEHKVTVPAISVSPIIFSTANPVDIQVANNIDAATYMWEVDGGKVVKKLLMLDRYRSFIPILVRRELK